MRNSIRMSVLAAVFFCTAALAAAGDTPRVKVGFFVDSGSRGGAVLHWARILHYSPQLEVTMVDGRDIRDGKLKGLDLLMVPGGSSSLQCRAMGEEGRAEVRRFVAAGGSYLGACAGYHCALKGKERIGLFPYKRLTNGFGGAAMLRVELFDNAAQALGIPKGNYTVRYSLGPIAEPADSALGDAPAKAEVLGVYRAFVSPAGSPGKNFFGAPAMLMGTYGKGKVIATSFHPESRRSSWPIVLGSIYAVTGVRPTPVLPAKNRRPLRVGCYPSIDKRSVREVLELDRDPNIDLRFVNSNSFDDGELEHLDVMIFPERPGKQAYKKMSDQHQAAFAEFMERGGQVLVTERDANLMPGHRNLRIVPGGESLVKAALAMAGADKSVEK